jgi:putative peptide zinc metalloprotease protein
MQAEAVQFIPYQRHELPSAALAIPYGGQINAAQDAQGRMIAHEPFFAILALLPSNEPLALHDGAVGYMKVRLSSLPPMQQLTTQIRQLLQTRYRL